jgi:hypothetical protein
LHFLSCFLSLFLSEGLTFRPGQPGPILSFPPRLKWQVPLTQLISVEMGSHKLFCLGCTGTMTHRISASQTARIAAWARVPADSMLFFHSLGHTQTTYNRAFLKSTALLLLRHFPKLLTSFCNFSWSLRVSENI